MAVTAAPARPASELARPSRTPRGGCRRLGGGLRCTHRADTDWAAELLGDSEHRHEHATLDGDGYHVDSFGVQRVAHQRGTPTCGSSARSASARRACTPARRTHDARDRRGADARPGPRAGHLRPANRRRRRSHALGTRCTAARSPLTSDARRWLPRSLTTVRSAPPAASRTGRSRPARSGPGPSPARARAAASSPVGRAGAAGTRGRGRRVAPVAAAVRQATRAPDERPPTYSGRPFSSRRAAARRPRSRRCRAGPRAPPTCGPATR